MHIRFSDKRNERVAENVKKTNKSEIDSSNQFVFIIANNIHFVEIVVYIFINSIMLI